MGWKKFIFGEKIPDKSDPKYKAQREREVSAGRKVAKALRVDKLAAKTQRVALKYPKIFLLVVFGFVSVSLGYNVFRMVRAYNHPERRDTAVGRQDALFKQKRRHSGSGDVYQEQEKLLKDEVDVLSSKGNGMTHDDSLRVKFLLEQLVRMNNLRKEEHDNR